MKKLLPLIIALILLSALTVGASAAELIPVELEPERLTVAPADGLESWYPAPEGLDTYEDAKLRLRDAMVKARENGSTRADFVFSNEEWKEFEPIFFNTVLDFPEDLYWCATGYKSAGGFPSGRFVEMYVYENVDDAVFRAAVDEAVLRCFGEEPEKLSDLEKIVLAHDYLASTVTYDKDYGDTDERVYSAYGALVLHNAVCQGYSRAFSVLLDRVGVKSCYVASNEMNHGWNMAELDGKWYHVDSTWDNGMIMQETFLGLMRTKNLLKSDEEIEGHYGWTTEYGHVCPESYPLPAFITPDAKSIYINDLSWYPINTVGTPVFAYGGSLWKVRTDRLYEAVPGTDFAEYTEKLELPGPVTALIYDTKTHSAFIAAQPERGVMKVYRVFMDDMSITELGETVNILDGIHIIEEEGRRYVSTIYTYEDGNRWDITDYAPLSYNVTYDANGGEGAPEPQVKIHNEKLVLSDVIPTMENKIFLGWATDPEAAEPGYQPGDIYAENAELQLYAIWGPAGYFLTYDPNDGETAPSRTLVPVGEAYSIPGDTPTRKYYNFLGWATSPEAEQPEYKPGDPIELTGDLTLYAVWERITYTVEFKANLINKAHDKFVENMPGKLSVPAGEKFALPDTVPVFAYAEFLGWTNVSTGTAAVFKPGSICELKGNSILYGVWEGNTYSVSFDGNGEGAEGLPEPVEVKYGGALYLPKEVPAREHYEFLGWASVAKPETTSYFQPGKGYRVNWGGDRTFFAQWKAVPYTLGFDLAGGSGSSESVTYSADEPYIVPEDTPTRTGYDFAGWTDGEGVWLPGDAVPVLGDATLTATWTVKTEYAIHDALLYTDTGKLAVIATGDGATLVAAAYRETGQLAEAKTVRLSSDTAEYEIQMDDPELEIRLYLIDGAGKPADAM